MKKRILTLILIMSMVLLTACNEDNYKIGIYTLDGYASEYLGYRFVTPEGFTLIKREEINQLMNDRQLSEGDEAIESDDSIGEVQLKYADRDNIYEMIAIEDSGSAVMIVAVSKAKISADIYLEILKANLEDRTENLKLNDTDEEVVIGNHTYKKLSGVIEEEYTQNIDLCFREVDNRMMSILVLWLDGNEEKRDILLDGFESN